MFGYLDPTPIVAIGPFVNVLAMAAVAALMVGLAYEALTRNVPLLLALNRKARMPRRNTRNPPQQAA